MVKVLVPLSQNGSAVERVERKLKPAAGKLTGTAMQFVNGFSFDPHPTRTKIIRGVWVGIPAFIAGGLVINRLIGRMSRS